MTSAQSSTPASNPIPWKRAFGLTCLAVYAPFVATAIYTLALVACPHCKSTFCTLLPISPGVIAGFMTNSALQISKSAPFAFGLSGFYSLLVVVGIASLVRRGGSWPAVALGLSGFIFFLVAILTLKLIQA